MTTTKLLITCIFCCAVYSYTSAKGDIKQNSPEWLPLSEETQSLWAADTVHTMAISLKQNQLPFLQNYAIVTKEKYDSHICVMIDAAKHFDSQSTPVFKSISNGRKVDVMNDSEFEEWMLAATKHKVKLLELLTKFVKEWNQ